MKQLKSNPVYKNVIETRDSFINEDGFDRQEALEAVIIVETQ